MAMATRIQTLVLTGMSGAGKTVAMQSLEDVGFFCVDNLPPILIPKFMEVAEQSAAAGSLRKVALACDLRGREWFRPLLDTVVQLRENPNLDLSIVFLDASDAALVKRYKESRRRHPIAPEEPLLKGIALERRALAELRSAADIVLDTSDWRPIQLKQAIVQQFADGTPKMVVHVVSFGFKYGVPIDADMIFDVRFLPNPHYVDDLRPFTGEDAPVYEYVMKSSATQEFLGRTEDLLDFLIPQFIKEGKSHLMLGVGCTGGKHRSVAIARHLSAHLQHHAEVHLTHRDSRREG
jgi:UPF0042 nucleotide-binding protein